MAYRLASCFESNVASYMLAWIEIFKIFAPKRLKSVASYMLAWIEIIAAGAQAI